MQVRDWSIGWRDLPWEFPSIMVFRHNHNAQDCLYLFKYCLPDDLLVTLKREHGSIQPSHTSLYPSSPKKSSNSLYMNI